MYIKNDFGTGLSEVFGKVFTAGGGVIAESIGYNEDETDFRPYLNRIRSSKPDGIYIAGYYQDGGSLLRQARELGLKQPILGAGTHEDPRLLEIAQSAAEGFTYPVSTGYEENSQAREVSNFRNAFERRYKRKPGLVAADAYDCIALLVDAVETNGPDPEAIRAYLAQVHGFAGAAGAVTFDANGDVQKPVRLKQVRQGKFVFVD